MNRFDNFLLIRFAKYQTASYVLLWLVGVSFLIVGWVNSSLLWLRISIAVLVFDFVFENICNWRANKNYYSHKPISLLNSLIYRIKNRKRGNNG